MIIYSVTVTVDHDIEREWFEWMQAEHIPAVMATGCFTAAHMNRLLDPTPEKGTATFNIQYQVENLAHYRRYMDMFAPGLQALHSERYTGKFVAFRTLLRRESEF